MTTPDLSNLTAAIKAGKRKDAKAITQEALDANLPPGDILDALKVGMDDVGKRFKANEIFVPEVLVAARAMKTAMELLEPVLVESGIQPEHKVVIGTVEGDLHDIGKNLVAMMLKGANFEVIDLGTNVTPDAFVEAVREHGAQVVGLSALLTTTMPAMKATVQKMRELGLEVKIMVGGAPITDAFAAEIGADGFSPDAASAVDLARTLAGAAA
jgi:5-methyltetrahydrofolate--homocysteine methyltransferase